MVGNPKVNRSLADKAMDHIDHALGRPTWPRVESFRNYFATEAGSAEAIAFDASPHWRLRGRQRDMLFYSVTDLGRQALTDYLSQRPEYRRWRVIHRGHESIVTARTAAKARYLHWLDIAEIMSGLRFVDYARHISVRRA